MLFNIFEAPALSKSGAHRGHAERRASERGRVGRSQDYIFNINDRYVFV